MSPPEIEEFDSAIVQWMRDESMGECDIHCDLENETAESDYKRQLRDSGEIELLALIVPECVDSVLFYCLHHVDNELLNMSFVSESGQTIALEKLGGTGSLEGWFVGDWIKQLSRERFNDWIGEVELPDFDDDAEDDDDDSIDARD